MLEERIERVKALLVERLTEGMDFVELGQIEAHGVAPLLTERLVAQAEALLERERGRRADSGLSYDHPRVKAILERLDDVLLDVMTFSKAEIEQVAEEQVQREIMLRMRPMDVISHVFSPEEGSLPVTEVVEVLSKLPVQAFYGEGMKAYAREHADQALDRETVVGVLRGIEKEALATDAVGVVMGSVASVLEFLKQRRVEDGDEVDLDLVRKILLYYGMRDQARVIEVERMLGRERLALGQVRRILEVMGRSEDTEETAQRDVHEAIERKGAREQGVDVLREGGEEAGQKCADGKRPREEPVLEPTEEERGQTARVEEARGEEEMKEGEVEPETMGEHAENVREAAELGENPKGSLGRGMGQKEERYFIRKLFAKDREIYDMLMEQLEGAPTWEEASKIMQRFWEDHGIDPGSKAAERFTDVIFGRYPSHG